MIRYKLDCFDLESDSLVTRFYFQSSQVSKGVLLGQDNSSVDTVLNIVPYALHEVLRFNSRRAYEVRCSLSGSRVWDQLSVFF